MGATKGEQHCIKDSNDFKTLFTSRLHALVIADVEAFAKAMESETKSEQEGDSKDKKDDDEDMSLD